MLAAAGSAASWGGCSDTALGGKGCCVTAGALPDMAHVRATLFGVAATGRTAACALKPGRRVVDVCAKVLDAGRGGTVNACNVDPGFGVAQVAVDVALGALSCMTLSSNPAPDAVLVSADEDGGGKLGLLGVECGVGALSWAW